MKNLLKEAVHEFHHAIDGGADYEATIQWLSQYFSIPANLLEKAYNDYVMSL